MNTSSSVFRFLVANLAIAGVGFFAPRACLVAALATYFVAIIIRYFEEGRVSPEWAMARFLSMLFPILPVHVVGGLQASPLVKWLYASAFAQFAIFCVYVHYRA